MKTRREFLQRLGAGASGAAAPAILRGAAARRPNILFAIADDWSWPFASLAGDRTVKTAAFDRIASEGVLFRRAYAVAPTCTASRGAILTGQWFGRLREGSNLNGTLPANLDVYPDLFEKNGYHVGFTGKGWGPGDFRPGGRTRNPAGPEYNEHKLSPPTTGIHNNDYVANFADFLKKRPAGTPFCFWYGGFEPHRVYEAGSGLRAGKRAEDVRVPPPLPDVPEVRSDLLDYAVEIEWFNAQLGRIVQMLERSGELDNTLIAVTGDNGLPFPRCKANLYDWGTHVPLAVRWGGLKGGRTVEDFVSLADLAPTFLEAAGLKPAAGMTGRSLMNVLGSAQSGWVDPRRKAVLVGRERHTVAQPDNENGYPMRAIRTGDFLFIRNFRPERLPAGYDPDYRDIDSSPTKSFMIEHRNSERVANLFELGFGKRPAEELYDLRKDPGELRNVAGDAAYAETRAKLSQELDSRLKEWQDPRALGKGDAFDHYTYYGRKTPPGKRTR